MKRGYKYKIKPTFKQKRMLERMFGCVRFIYNWGYDRKQQVYAKNKKFLSYIDLAKELTQLKKQPGKEWLSVPSINSLQQSLRCLDNAFTNFFKKRAKYPVKKSKRFSKGVCKFIGSISFDFENWKVKIPKLGWVNLCKNRPFDVESVRIGTLTVTKDCVGEYWVSVLVEDSVQCRPKPKVCRETAVGVDLGVKTYATLSDGTKFDNPKHLERVMGRLKILQRIFSRTQLESKRHERLRRKIAKYHQSVVNQRTDFQHRLSTHLVRNFDTICLEDLNVRGLMQNHNMANSIQSASWAEFDRQLIYKSEWYGKNLLFINRFAPSSQMCNDCGYKNPEVKNLDVREWACPVCGVVHDRDVNAAKNIRDMALHPQSLVGFENKIPEMTGILTGR